MKKLIDKYRDELSDMEENEMPSEQIIRVRREDGKWNFKKNDGSWLSKEWFTAIWFFRNGYALVEREYRKYNYLKEDGSLISDEDFVDAWKSFI